MSTSTPTITLEVICDLAKDLATSRDLLAERVTALHDEITTAKNRKLPGIKSAVAATKEAESKLEAALVAAPTGLFTEPRTIVVHGLRVGFAKGRGKIEWADESSVVAKIEELFPKGAPLLIKTVKTVRKKALGALKADELKKLGCTVRAAGDYVYIEPVADQVDKLVSKLLKEESTPESED